MNGPILPVLLLLFVVLWVVVDCCCYGAVAQVVFVCMLCCYAELTAEPLLLCPQRKPVRD